MKIQNNLPDGKKEEGEEVMQKTKDLIEIIKKIEGDQQKIAGVKKILGYDCFTENAKSREEAIDKLWRCAEFAETVEEFLKNADEDDVSISVEVQKLMQRYIRNGLGIKR